jgi:hypothetical protein
MAKSKPRDPRFIPRGKITMQDENDSYLKPGQKDENDSYVGQKMTPGPAANKKNALKKALGSMQNTSGMVKKQMGK